MRHAARHPRRRRHRFIPASLSALTLAVAMLGAIGLLPFDFGVKTVAGGDLPEHARTLVDRARHADEPPPLAPSLTSQSPTGSPSPVPSTTAISPAVVLPPGTGVGTRIVYSLGLNRVWLVKGSDTVVRSYLVSGTKYGQLDPGRYSVIRKRLHTTSWHGTERMDYMVTFTFGDRAAIGFHDIPVNIATGLPVQKTTQLGQSLSDGCVRQARPDAKALWDFAPQGTPVVVLT
ncbi:MAG TPA: L,D-transpeptidase [Actinopolymorphaceae bacterium]|nr:L,D-transpeptidase [Actinopolymorphaceae bacterium]